MLVNALDGEDDTDQRFVTRNEANSSLEKLR